MQLWTLHQGEGPAVLVHTVQTQLCSTVGSELPTQPHVRLAPETVAAAQLHALQQGQLATAAGFDAFQANAMDTTNVHQLASRPDHAASSDAMLARMLTWRRLLAHPCYAALGDAAAAVAWGPSAMRGPGEALLEATVGGSGFVWRVVLQGDGCWRVADVMVAQLGLGRGVEMPRGGDGGGTM